MNESHHQDELDLGLLPGQVADEAGSGPRDGISWTWEPDLGELLAAVTGPAPWTRDPAKPTVSAEAPGSTDTDPGLDPAEADWAEYLDAVESGRSEAMPLPVVAGRVAESVPAGPELAGWLETGQIGGLEDGALAGIASSYRRLASWAQAGELAAVAELASRSAAADDRIGVGDGGRPARISPSACAEVSLALTMSQAAASWWADLAVTLRWRLAATGAALASGAIDLARARAIADATGFLDEETARAVQDRVLPKAGAQTTAQLRAALRRAVIAADPAGADRRREEAERRAKVMLYPDAEGTASLGGYSLPGIPATAAMARITALARALQASGAGGGIDLLRGHVFLGLLLGTLPYIPPAADAPPDQPSPDDEPSAYDEPPGNDEPLDCDPPNDSLPQDQGLRSRAPADCPGRDDHRSHRTNRRDDGSHHADRGGHGIKRARPATQGSHRTDDRDQAKNEGSNTGQQPPSHHDNSGGRNSQSDNAGSQANNASDQPKDRRPEPGDQRPDPDGRRSDPDDRRPKGQRSERDGPYPGRLSHDRRVEPIADDTDVEDAEALSVRPPPAWPEVPALLRAGPAAMNHLIPVGGAGGLLDLRLAWTTLVGESHQPGYLGRIGPITPGQAQYLAGLATTDPGTRWRVILTNPKGQAIGTSTLTRQGIDQQARLIKQVTVTLGLDCMTKPRPDDLPPDLRRMLDVAQSLADRAASSAQTDDGCAHDDATASYRPTARLRDYITARDLTCRFPTCRQPVWRCDLDHSTPFDEGGRTCSCNLGCLCRFHHQVKGQACWRLDQSTPGVFTWTTPTGRRYTVEPDSYVA